MLVLLGAGGEQRTKHPCPHPGPDLPFQRHPGVCSSSIAQTQQGAKESVPHTRVSLGVHCSFLLLPEWADPMLSLQAPFLSSCLTSRTHVPLYAKYLLVLYTLSLYRHNHRTILHSFVLGTQCGSPEAAWCVVPCPSWPCPMGVVCLVCVQVV